MINTNIDAKNMIKGFFWGAVSKLLVGIKVSFVVGSGAAFFSLTNCALPLIGTFSNVTTAGLFFLVSMVARSLFSPISLLKLSAFYVPGFVAALSFMPAYRFMQLYIPALCMLAFIAHPAGAAAWLYAMYWLIPMALYIIDSKNLFARSLATTFVAHAVGSTLWLYAGDMTASAWLALIPVVAYERVLFALGMTIIYNVVRTIQESISEYMHKTKAYVCNTVHTQ